MERKDTSQEQAADGADSNSQRWCEILDVTPGANTSELKAAYERAIALIDGKSVGGYLMLDPIAAQAARDDVERAYQELKRSAPAAPPDDASANEKPSADLGPDSTANEMDACESPKEERYSSGVPRRVMRILAPVVDPAAESPPTSPPSSPPTPITIAKPAVQTVPPSDEGAAPRSTTESDVTPAKGTKEDAPSEDAPSEGEQPSDEAAALLPQVKLLPSIPPERAVGEVNVITPPDDDRFEIRDGDEINGGLIRRLREARSVTIEELAKTTKVQKSVLRAIEDQDFAALPARVYLRGFLTQIARVLKVDRKRLADGYLEFVERHGSRN